jgi:DNA-binding NtrC family response regulator
LRFARRASSSTRTGDRDAASTSALPLTKGDKKRAAEIRRISLKTLYNRLNVYRSRPVPLQERPGSA